jgi:hypothetical protein
MFATENNLVLLPSLDEGCEDSTWVKFYRVLCEMNNNPNAVRTVESSFMRFKLHGIEMRLYKSRLYVDGKDGQKVSILIPVEMWPKLSEYIEEMNRQAADDIFSDFLTSL